MAAGAATIAPIAAAAAAGIGLGMRGNSFLKDNGMEAASMGSIWDEVVGNDEGEDSWVGGAYSNTKEALGGGILGTAVGGLAGAGAAVGSGVALAGGALLNIGAGAVGLAGDAVSLLTSW